MQNEEPSIYVQAGFSTAQMEKETPKLLKKYEEAAKKAAQKFDGAMAKVSNNETLRATKREVDRLAKAYDPAYAKAKRYEQEVRRLNRALELGAIDQKQYAAALSKTVAGLERGTVATRRFSGAAVASTRAANRSGARLQQVGFQVGDFATQVGAGTSAVQALGQQLPQLLGAFGAMGALAGAGAAIFIPLGASLYRLYTDSVNLEDQLKKLDEVTGDYARAAELALTPIANLRLQYGDMAETVASVNEEMAILFGASAKVEFGRGLSEFTKSSGGFDETPNTARGRNKGPGPANEYEKTVRSVAKKFEIDPEQARKIVDVYRSIDEATNINEKVIGLDRLLSTFTEVAGGGGKRGQDFWGKGQ